MSEPSPRPSDSVQSLKRGLAVIRAFDAEHAHRSLAEVAQAAGLPRAAARRFLHTLVELGYVHFDGRLFSLRPRVLELGFAYLSSLGFPEVAQPHMEALAAEVGESTSIAVLDDLDVVYVARVPTRRIMSISIAVGTRFPAYATSMGRVLLAGLPEAERERQLARVEPVALTARTVTDLDALRATLTRVRAQGWALVDQELEDGLRSLAVPIHDRSGAITAAMNVSTHASRATLQELRRDVLPALLAAAGRIEADARSGGLQGPAVGAPAGA